MKMRNEEYEQVVEGQVQDYARRATVYGRLHSTLQISTLLGAIALPFIVITSIVPTFVPMSQWTPIVLSLIVAGAASVDGYFRFGETCSRLRAVCKMVAREQRLYRFEIEPYRELDAERQLEMFMKQVEVHLGEVAVPEKQNDAHRRAFAPKALHLGEMDAPTKQITPQEYAPASGTLQLGEADIPSRQGGGYNPALRTLHND